MHTVPASMLYHILIHNISLRTPSFVQSFFLALNQRGSSIPSPVALPSDVRSNCILSYVPIKVALSRAVVSDFANNLS